jgi:regulator of protease activity HflC (stomatin/prohibitin superfamily)
MKKFSLKRLVITLVVGGGLTAIFYVWQGWSILTVTLLLLTFLFIGLSLPRRVWPAYFTVYAAALLAVIFGSIIRATYPDQSEGASTARRATAAMGGLLTALVLVGGFWLAALYTSTTWILEVSKSLGIPWWDAFQYVATRVFGLGQRYVVVENGQILTESPPKMLSRFGGPGILVVKPGNAVVLEQGGRISDIVGQGVRPLGRFEYLMRPVEVKGIVDLRPQWKRTRVKNVLTSDGIPLQIIVGMGYQIEPQGVTDRRPSSRLAGGEATTPLVDGEYPVYKATIRNAVLATTADGWAGLFPAGPVLVLRDVVAAYTLDQIFPPAQVSHQPNPDARTIRRIEDEVVARFDPRWAGVQFRSFDIEQIRMPEEIRERMVRRWTAVVERDLKLRDAETERESIIQLSEGRAVSLERMEQVRFDAWQQASDSVEGAIERVTALMAKMAASSHPQIAANFIAVVEQLTVWFGQDQSTAMRYIEAIESVAHSKGTKTFVFNPPNALTGMPPRNAGDVRMLPGQGYGIGPSPPGAGGTGGEGPTDSHDPSSALPEPDVTEKS